MDPAQFFAASRVVIVAGKGGVGKTTVSAALARAAALVGLSTLIVEVEGKSGLATLFGQPAFDYEEVTLSPGGGPDGAADVSGPHPHARRRAGRVPRGPRHEPHLAPAGLHRRGRHGRHRRPRHQGHPHPGQGQAARAAAQGRPHRARRPGGGPRHQLPALGPGAPRRRAGRADQHPGPRRARAADRPRALPGAARDPARGDAGQRAGRDRLQPRGRGRHQPRARSSSTASTPSSTGSTPTRPWPRPRRAPRCAPARPRCWPTRPRSAATAWRCRPSRSSGWPTCCPLPQLTLPFLFDADLGPAEVDLLADRLLTGIGDLTASGRPGMSHRATAADPRAELARLVVEQEVIVCTGSGGVGKTTTAAVIALEGARQGRRACVVTIDPAKRLADALGLESLSNTPSRIEGPWAGELWALMLDTKTTFDDLVHQERRDRPSRPRASSTTASTATSPARSRARRSTWRWRSSTSCTTSGRFDLVVVDTPPTRNALDFLEAPRRLTRFLDHRLYRVLMAPDPGHRQGGQRGRPGVPAHRVARSSAATWSPTPSPSSPPSTAWSRASASGPRPPSTCCRTTSPRSCSSPRRRREVVAEATLLRRQARRGRHPGAGPDRQPHAPEVRRRRPRARRASGPGTSPAPTSAALYANLADFQQVAANEEDHLVGLAGKVAPGPRRAGPVPADRRARPRRSGRDRPPPLPALTRTVLVSASRSPLGAPPGRARRAAQSRSISGGLSSASTAASRVSVTGHDAVEAGGVEQPGEGRAAAGHRHVALGLAGAADAADERAEPGGVHERHVGQVDEEPGLGRQLDQRLAELADRVGVELTHGAAQRVRGGLLDVDLEHETSRAGCARGALVATAADAPSARGHARSTVGRASFRVSGRGAG